VDPKIDRQNAIQALSWCDQICQALQDGDEDAIHLMRGKLVYFFAKAEELDIVAAVDLVRTKALLVLKEQGKQGEQGESDESN